MMVLTLWIGRIVLIDGHYINLLWIWWICYVLFNTYNLGKSNCCTYVTERGKLYFLLEFDVFLFWCGIRSDYDFLRPLIGTCWVHGNLWPWTFVFLVGHLISSLGLSFCIVINHEVPGIYPSWPVSFDI